MKPKHNLAAGLFALLAAAPAMAQQAADVTVGHLRYTLVDLDPDDGIAPWIGLNSYSTLAYAHVYDQEGHEIERTQIEQLGAAGFDNDYASLHVDARDDAASVALTLHSGWGYADTSRSFRFLLSPNTRVVFSVDADLWARPEAPGVSWPTAIAELYGSSPGIDDGERFTDTLTIEDGSRQGTLSVTAASHGDWVNGRITFDAYAVAESHALPVPEPAMPTMVVAGLGVLAFARRLRNGSAQARQFLLERVEEYLDPGGHMAARGRHRPYRQIFHRGIVKSDLDQRSIA